MKQIISTIFLCLAALILIVYSIHVFTSDEYYFTFFGYNPDRKVIATILGIAFFIVLFFAVRSLNLWYWEISKRRKLLENIDEAVKNSNKKLDIQNTLLALAISKDLTAINISITYTETNEIENISLQEWLMRSYDLPNKYEIVK